MASDRKKTDIKGKKIEYVLRRRRGSKSLRLAIFPDGAFVVTAPKWYPIYIIERFIQEKADWIFERIKNVDFSGLAEKRKIEKGRYKKEKEAARKIITKRVQELNGEYGFAYSRIAIKNQKSCWGSCSRKGNLNFNYKVAYLPEELRDYVIIHELCHLKELNHGRNFWSLVESSIPDYAEKRKSLRAFKN